MQQLSRGSNFRKLDPPEESCIVIKNPMPVQVLLPHQTYRKVKLLCAWREQSVNDFLNKIIDEATNDTKWFQQ